MYDSSANTCERRSFQRVMIMRLPATPLVANDIGVKLLVLVVVLGSCSGGRDGSVERSLMVHLGWMVMHAETQAQAVVSIVVRLWRYMIMTVWICVVGVCLLSLRVFFIPEKLRGKVFVRNFEILKVWLRGKFWIWV